MNRTQLKLFLVLGGIGLIAAACPAEEPLKSAAEVVGLQAWIGPQTWIDAPVDGATIPNKASTIVVHTAVGVCAIEIRVEGKDPSISHWETSCQASGCGIGGTIGNPVPEKFVWTPLGPGTYTVKARGFLYGQQYGPWATAKVTVSDEAPTLAEVPVEVFGPQAWIDAPLDGDEIPLAPYEIVAHASSPHGVASFEFSVNGMVENPTLVNPEQSGETLAYIMFEWTPPAPGTYLLSVRAADANGEYGPMTEARVTVGGEAPGEKPPEKKATPTDTPTPRQEQPQPQETPEPGEPSPTPSLTPTITPTPTFTPTPTATFTPTPGVPLIVSFAAQPPEIDPGGSSNLTCQIQGAIRADIYGNPVNPSTCDFPVWPDQTTDYVLRACSTESDDSCAFANTTVTVREPSDTAGPSLNRVAASPGVFYQGSTRCGPLSVTITANITDPSGVQDTTLFYRMVIPGVDPNPGWQTTAMGAVGGDNYQAALQSANLTALPSTSRSGATPEGMLEFYVVATDTVGNLSQSATDSSVRMRRC